MKNAKSNAILYYIDINLFFRHRFYLIGRGLMRTYHSREIHWEDGKIFLFYYHGKKSLLRNDFTELLWRFENAETQALADITSLAKQAIFQYQEQIRSIKPFWHLITQPRHGAGQLNRHCEIVCRRLSDEYPWLVPIPNALRRIEDVVDSSQARANGLPGATYEDHMRTISYRGCLIDEKNYGIMLVDDVFTKGNTFRACSEKVRDATWVDQILGLFAGKNVTS
jgi:hypothetical protein